MKRYYYWRKGVKFVLLFIVAVFALGALVMVLWNWLIPDIFNGPALTLWQSIGLLLLAKILFSGFGRRWRRGKEYFMWRKHMERRMASMNPEERQKFRESLRRCYEEKSYSTAPSPDTGDTAHSEPN